MGIKITYKHLVEKPNLCGSACIQMILLRRGMWIDQEQIAKSVDTKIPKKDLDKYKIKLKTTENKDKFGISFKDFKGKRIKNFLAKQNLKTRIFYISEIKDVKLFVEDNLIKGSDIIANFYMRHFDKSKDWGHFSLIASVKNNNLTIVDPEPSNKSEWQTGINKLSQAMGEQFDGRERGFIVIS